MDPLSILGAAVGITSLIMQTTDECVRVFNVYNQAINMPEAYRYISVRMQIEQQRFLNFSLEAGTLHVDGDVATSLRLDRSLLVAVLAEIKTLFENYARKNGRYEEIASKHGNAAGTDDNDDDDDGSALTDLLVYDPTTSEKENIAPEATPKLHRKSLRKLGTKLANSSRNLRKVIREPRRLVWGLMDKDSFEALLARLKDLNTVLINLLDNSQTRRLQETMQTTYQEILLVRNDLKSLHSLVMALDSVKTTIMEVREPPPYQIHSHEDDIARLKELAKVKIQYSQSGQLGDHAMSTSQTRTDTQLSIRRFFFTDEATEPKGGTRRTSGKYEGMDVWIEWKDVSHFSPSLRETRARISLLTQFLLYDKPEEFRAPPCLGFVETSNDEGGTRFGIVYQKPTETTIDLRTLRDLFSLKKPSLSARMSCCAVLARSLQAFHSINWYHKGFRSDSISFFSKSLELAEPYVSGFELSRPSHGVNMTEKPEFDPQKDIYRHPSAQAGRNDGPYQRYYDLYSLGVVLVEIALWMPIEQVAELTDLATARPQTLHNIRPWLLGEVQRQGTVISDPQGESCMQLVAASCGDVFRDIVRSCLTAGDISKLAYAGEPESSVALRLQAFVEKEVVKPLGRLADILDPKIESMVLV